jgi:hypothetical protein
VIGPIGQANPLQTFGRTPQRDFSAEPGEEKGERHIFRGPKIGKKIEKLENEADPVAP